ncbi:hypothetical protein MBLNU230_g3823t1 [Neophaeotheca triangularis]
MVSLASPAGAMQPPAIPQSQRPTIGMKRDSSYLDSDNGGDDDNSSVSTLKRRKVAFDPDINVRFMEDWDVKSMALVREEVRTGIERHLAGGELRDDTQYTKLVQLLQQENGADNTGRAGGKLMKRYLLALESRVSMLGECGKLADAALNLNWLGRDETFATLWTKFAIALVSSHSKYLFDVMDRLVGCFARLPASLGRLPGEESVSRQHMYTRLHTTIQTILKHIPSASSGLVRAIRYEFPNNSATSRTYLQYQRHLLRMAEYAPELKAEVLALIVQRVADVDAHIQEDIEDLEDEAEEQLLQRPSSKDGDAEDSDESDDDSMSESEFTTSEEELRLKEIRLKVAKMDGTLDLLFEYYTPLIRDGSGPRDNKAFQQLMSHFTTFILPRRSRHTQFLIFHFAQTTPTHSAYFARHCMELAFTQTKSPVIRLTACAYVASFVARGTHLPTRTVRDLWHLMADYLNSMRSNYERSCRGPDKRSFPLYYAVTQALLYIFCFRWRDLVTTPLNPSDSNDNENETYDDLLETGHDLTFLPSVKETLTLNIYSPLNPLKVCSPPIVSEFAKLAHHLRFLYIYPLLETNKRVRFALTSSYYGNSSGIGGLDVGRRETAMDRKSGEEHLKLEAYFPFDPYHLPVSKRWVQGEYNEWVLPRGLRGEDEDESEDDGESEVDEEEGEEGISEDEEQESEGEDVVYGESTGTGVLPQKALVEV